ncbi:MAG: hypothetical protein NC395_12025 [Prevotella sp.]|nr:hypothetical protein [Prevotella sp.]
MNVAELKKRILRGFAYPELFFLPIKQAETGVGTLIIKHLLHRNFDVDTMSFTDDTTAYRGMKYVIFNAAKQVVYSNKSFTPPTELEISLPGGKYTIKIIYIDAGITAKEKMSEVEVIPNKTVTHIMGFFVDLYKHELKFGVPDGANIFENDPEDEFQNHHMYYVEKTIYFKTENIYRCVCKNALNPLTEIPVCHIKNVPQMYVLGALANTYVFLLGIPTYATSKEDYNSLDETLEFIGFGEVRNSAPIIEAGASFARQNAVIKRDYKMISRSETQGTDYIVTSAHIPAVTGFPPINFFDSTLYDPEIKNVLWGTVGNRLILKNMSRTEMIHYICAAGNGNIDGWEEVPDGTYIREFLWDNSEFYDERMIVKKRGLNWLNFSAVSGAVIINGVKKSVNTFYVYSDDGEEQYKFGGFVYYSDDYDQY